MRTLKAMEWAMQSQLMPESKLMAIYVASMVGMSRFVKIGIYDAADFCGFRTPAKNKLQPYRVLTALQGIPLFTFERDGNWITVDTHFEGSIEP